MNKPLCLNTDRKSNYKLTWEFKTNVADIKKIIFIIDGENPNILRIQGYFRNWVKDKQGNIVIDKNGLRKTHWECNEIKCSNFRNYTAMQVIHKFYTKLINTGKWGNVKFDNSQLYRYSCRWFDDNIKTVYRDLGLPIGLVEPILKDLNQER